MISGNFSGDGVSLALGAARERRAARSADMYRADAKLLLALVSAAVLVGIAPFVELMRRAAQSALPAGYVPLLVVVFAVGVGGGLVWAARQIRERRLQRWATIGMALGLMAAQIFGWNRGMVEIDAVERIHFLFYGVLALLFYRAFRHRARFATVGATLLAVSIVGVLDEWLQWLVPVRTGDLFDVVLNAYAGLCGLLFSVAALGPAVAAGDERRVAARLIAGLAVVLLLVIGGFVHSAHLGYAHVDPEIGTFHSYFTLDELATLDRRRSAEWQRHPPGPLRPLEIEDYFRSEAGWRVNYRNAMRSNGDAFRAFQENLILERYYPAFLDLGHRLAPEQRQQLARELPRSEPSSYVSDADQGRVFVRPTKLVWWLLIAALMGSVVAALGVYTRLSRSSRPWSPAPGGR